MQPLLLSFEALERKAPALCSSTLLLGRPSHNNPFRPGHSATARSARHTLRLQAAVSPVLEERVELPLQLHRLLQVSQAANRETCKRVIEKLSCSPPAVGYTKATIASRERVLKELARFISEDTGRQLSYTRSAAAVPFSEIPGALVLLQEAGDLQSVLSWGDAWLREHPDSKQSSDVALAVALAHCDLAAAKLDVSGSDVLECVNKMQLANSLLQKYACGPVLQRDIQKALEELAPQVALRQLTLSLDHSLRHQQGMLNLQRILWRNGQPVWEFPSLHMDRSTYLQEACAHMTAAEQVALFESAPEGAPVPGDELYQIALAHVVDGMHTFSPQRIATADKMFAFLASQPRQEGEREVSVEIAVCKLLLGDTSAAEAALGLGPDSPSAPDPDIHSFVKSFCDGSEDLLPGLVMMAQQWLSDVLYPSFRGCDNTSLPLQKWFDHPRVSLNLKVRRKAQDLRLNGARSSLSAAAQAVTGAVASKWSALWEGPPDAGRQVPAGNALGGSQPAVPPPQGLPDIERVQAAAEAVAEPVEPWSELQSAPAGADAGSSSMTSRQRQLQELGDALEKQSTVQLSDVQGETVGSLQKRLAGLGSASQPAGEGPAARQRTPPAAAPPAPGVPPPAPKRRPRLPAAAGAPLLSSSALAAGIRPFAGEREMWSSVSPSARRRRHVRAWLACLWLLGVGVLAYRSWHTRAALPGAHTPAWSFIEPFRRAAPVRSDSISDRQAKHLIKSWQSAKAAALGQQHRTEMLADILTGPLLQQWQEATTGLQAQEKHWELILRNVEVSSAEVLVPGESAKLQATVQESAKLIDRDGAVEEAFDHPVIVEYGLSWHEDEGWRIAAFQEMNSASCT